MDVPLRVQRLRLDVIERDEGKCVLCRSAAVDVHEIVFRSKGKRWSPKIFRIENIICLCRTHHTEAHSGRKATIRLLQLMANTYDMEWAREFGYGDVV